MSDKQSWDFRSILEDSSEAIYITDMEYRLIYANKAALEIGTKVFHQDRAGETCYQTIFGRKMPCPFCKMKELSKEQYKTRCFSGATDQVFEVRGKLIQWEGKPAHIEYIKDISLKRYTQTEIDELKFRQTDLLEHIGAGVCLYEWKQNELRAIICNQAYRDFFQLPEEFDTGEPIQLQLANFHQDDRKKLLEEIPLHMKKREGLQKICRITDPKSGLTKRVFLRVECTSEDADASYWYVSTYDVTPWAEQELELNTVLNTVNGGIVVFDVDSAGKATILKYSDGFIYLHGYTKEEFAHLEQKNFHSFIYPEDVAFVEKEQKRTIAKGVDRFSITHRVCHKTKEYIWINCLGSLIEKTPEGKFRYSMVMTNVSNQLNLYHEMVDVAEIGLIVTDKESQEIFFTNQIADDIMKKSHSGCAKSATCSAINVNACALCDSSSLLPQGLEPRQVQVADAIYQVRSHLIYWQDRTFTAQYFTDITEEVHTLEKAEEASRAKSTFLARMSHEIRTPITTVAGVLDLIRQDCERGELSADVLCQRVDTASDANRYLLTLVNDILDISKIENNELKITPAPADVRKSLLSVVAMIRPLAEKKKIHFELVRKTNISNWYCTDSVRVAQIMMNLLSNAVKFTPEGGTVTLLIEAERLDEKKVLVKLTVSDTGVGISPEFLPYVFEPFKQEYADSRSKYGGTGIGLAISKKLAHLMGGDITVESEKGKGTKFVASVKMEITSPQEKPSAGYKHTGIRLDGITALLCEDNLINREIVKQLLEERGCTVITADNGKQGVEIFSESAPGAVDIILMDIRMPEMDGLEAVRIIRSQSGDDAKTIPIIAMSANAYEEDRQISLRAGMNEHLAKPVDPEVLYQTLQKYCCTERKGKNKSTDVQKERGGSYDK